MIDFTEQTLLAKTSSKIVFSIIIEHSLDNIKLKQHVVALYCIYIAFRSLRS